MTTANRKRLDYILGTVIKSRLDLHNTKHATFPINISYNISVQKGKDIFEGLLTLFSMPEKM